MRKRSAQIIRFSKYRKPVRRFRKSKAPALSRDERLAYGLATGMACKFGLGVRDTANLAERLQEILRDNLNYRFPKKGEEGGSNG